MQQWGDEVRQRHERSGVGHPLVGMVRKGQGRSTQIRSDRKTLGDIFWEVIGKSSSSTQLKFWSFSRVRYLKQSLLRAFIYKQFFRNTLFVMDRFIFFFNLQVISTKWSQVLSTCVVINFVETAESNIWACLYIYSKQIIFKELEMPKNAKSRSDFCARASYKKWPATQLHSKIICSLKN